MAVSFVLFLGAFIPFIGILIAPFSPLPLAILTVKYGPRHGLTVCVFTELVLGMLASPVYGIAFAPFVYVGFVLGVLAHRKASGGTIWAIGTLSLFVLLACLFYGFEFYASHSEHVKTINQSWDWVFSRLDKGGDLMAAVLSDNSAVVANYKALLVTLRRLVKAVFVFPLAFFMTLAALGFSMSYFVAGRMFDKLGFQLNGLPEFSTWRCPWFFAWAMILSYIATEWSYRYGDAAQRIYALNFLFVFLALYAVMGLSILDFFLRKWRLGFTARSILLGIAFALFTRPGFPLLYMIALIDPWYDFRGLDDGRTPRNEDASEKKETPVP